MIDLYSDTKTRPTAGMRAAMAAASVGDEQADEDPTTLRLCERVAGMLGMESGVFLPSGTMCNLVSVLSHTRPGDEVVCDAQAHLVATEAAGAAVFAGVSVRTIESPHGIFTDRQVIEALRPSDRTSPRSAMLSVEQSTNFSGGAVWPLEELRGVRDAAKDAGLRCHIDGARLLNASAASGIAPAEHARGWDSAWIDLSKGLGCPVGAVLCGSEEFIRSAWNWKYRLGGAMRQSGILAAAGLYALDHHLDKLGEDHRHALAIWRLLDTSGRFVFDPETPQTNIVRFRLTSDADAFAFAAAAKAQGVRVRAMDRRWLRLTTHLDVAEPDVGRAAEILGRVAEMAERATG